MKYKYKNIHRKIKGIHIPNERLEGLESFVLVSYAHINMALCLYIYGPAQVVSYDLL